MVVQQNIGGANVTAMFERGDAVTWQARSEQQHPYSLGSLRLDRGFGPLKLDIGLGLLREEDTLLGSSLGPVFGISGETTRLADARPEKIGLAACRERACLYGDVSVVGVSIKKN